MVDEDVIATWLKTRPPSVQALAEKFPCGSHWHVAGKVYWLIGYTEDDCLIVSQIDPYEDYDRAVQMKEYVYASRF